MTINRPLKVGDRIEPDVRGRPGPRLYESAVVKGLGEAHGEGYLWLLVERSNGTESIITFIEQVVMDGWKLVPDFFIEGKTYKYANLGEGVRFEIRNVYQVDNPINEREALAAVAEGTNPHGLKWIVLLNGESFKTMVEDLGEW